MNRMRLVTLTFCFLSLASSIYSSTVSHQNFTGDVTSQPNISTTGTLETKGNTTEEVEENGSGEECELTAASIEWAEVQYPMIITLFLFFSGLANLAYHHAGYLVTKIPETCLLIVLGTIAGLIFVYGTKSGAFPDYLDKMEPHLFFMVLLPPIVLESSYSLHDRVFLNNLGTILTFAVIGTVISFAIIGPLLWLLAKAGALPSGQEISFIHCMLFASIIVAVDPVAVLAIFQEVGVNSVLYFIVFGESLLNDAVTVVLYHTLDGMNCYIDAGEEITAVMYVIAFFKFFTSSIGGICIGVLFAVLTAVLTKYTVETRVVEPLLVFTLAYLSYLCSEFFGFSGIIGLTVCGLLQAQYAFHNISHKSYVTVKYFMKMASNVSDCVIFLFLGINLVRIDRQFHIGFIGATIFLCLITRFIVTYILSAILNRNRVVKISKREQLIMAYGGLRGAVAFSLVSLLEGKLDQGTQDLLMTTILMVIIFTVFIQGGTIKPLVSLLDIKTKEKNQKLSLLNDLTTSVADHVMAGVEEIIGDHGTYSFYNWVIQLDDKHIKHLLQRNPMRKDEKIMKLYEKIALKQHFSALKGTEAAEKFEESSTKNTQDEQHGTSVVESLEVGTGNTENSVIVGDTVSVSTGTARNGWKPSAPSLLGQLARYGNIEEPEHVDDIAYITPEMLEDEELTTAQQNKLTEEQNIAESNVKNGKQLRRLFAKPEKSMDTQKLRSEVDMDDRSRFMVLLQEKNKRLERLKRTQANGGTGSLSLSGTSSIRTAIQEAADVGGSRSFFRKCPCVRSKVEESGQIVRKRKIRKQDSNAGMEQSSSRCSVGTGGSPIIYSSRNVKKLDTPKHHNSADSDFYSGAEELESRGSCEDIELGRSTPATVSNVEFRPPLSTVVELPERDSEVSLARKAVVSKQIESTEADAGSDKNEKEDCQTRL